MNKKRGFAALMSVITVSAIISAIILPTSFYAYLTQSNIWATELKEESKLSAESCIDAAILLTAEFGDEISQTQIPYCKIHSVETVGDKKIIEVESEIKSESKSYHTFLRATLDTISQKIVFLEEVAVFK